MADLEINDYLRRALESAGGQFSELSVSFHEGPEEQDDAGTFLTDRPLTPGTAKPPPTAAKVHKLFKTDDSLKDIKASKATKLVGECCEMIKHNNFALAHTKLTRAIQMKGDVAHYYVLRGECCLQLCDFTSAITNYRHAIEMAPSPLEEWEDRLAFIHFFFSILLNDEHNYQAALEQVNLSLELKPNCFSYECRRVAYLFALKKHKACTECVEALLKIEKQAELFILRARIHKLFGRVTACFFDVHEALVLDPDNVQASIIVEELNKQAEEARIVAVNHALSGNVNEAIVKISLAIDTNPRMPQYNVFRGALLRQRGQYNEAIDDFMTALTKSGSDEASSLYKDTLRQLVLTYNDFAVECYMKEYYEEAISLLDKAIKREKNEKGFYLNRGDCFRMLGHLSFALADYQQALELEATDWVVISRISMVHHQYGVAEYANRRYQEAEKCFTTAITCNSKISQYYIARSWCRYMQKHLPAARADLIRALYLDINVNEGVMLSARLYPNQDQASILSAKSSEKIVGQMELLVAGEDTNSTKPVEAVLSSNTLPHEPLADENLKQYNVWLQQYKAGNSNVKLLLEKRPVLQPGAPKVIPQHKLENKWMKKHFSSGTKITT